MAIKSVITHPSNIEQFYVPFARMDEEKRTVCGYAFTSPRVKGDKWNLKRSTLERSAKSYMEMPCVRSMHGPLAAGKALSVHFDDKGAFIEAYIGDDNEWRKCRDGIYRGFSIGGKPLLVRGDDIEEFDWVETSLVDRPKDAGALFTMVRAEDGTGEVEVMVLDEAASDEELDFARSELGLERYDANQPRDDEGKWTIVAGHRVSVTGEAVDHSHIHDAKERFGLSDEVTGALLSAHKEGKITSDHHLYRTIAHAATKAGDLHAATSEHVKHALDHHMVGGSHEDQWHSESHHFTPQLQEGHVFGSPLGVHELKKGDIVHFPAHGGKPAIAGQVTKVNTKTLELSSSVGLADVGQKVLKSNLARPGFTKRDGKVVHHIELARGEFGAGLFDLEDELHFYAEALVGVVSRVEGAEAIEAIDQVAERLKELVRGGYDPNQPRNEKGQWTHGGGEGGSGKRGKGDTKDGTGENGGSHGGKGGESKADKSIDSSNKKPSDTDVLAAADKHGLANTEARIALLHAHEQGHVNSHEELEAVIKHAVQHGGSEGKLVNAVNLRGSGAGNFHGTPANDHAGPHDGGHGEGGHDGGHEGDHHEEGAEEHPAEGARTARHPIFQKILDAHKAVNDRIFNGLTKALTAKSNAQGADLAKAISKVEAYHTFLNTHNKVGAVLNKLATRPDFERLDFNDLELERLDFDADSISRGEFDLIESQLSAVRSSEEVALQRLGAVEGEVVRLEGENTRLETENTRLETEVQRLRQTPLERKSPISYPAIAVERGFIANDLLAPASDAGNKRQELLDEKARLLTQPSVDATTRSRNAARVMAIDEQLKHL